MSVKLRIDAIEKVKKGETQISVANELGVGAFTVRGWLKEESKFVENVIQKEGLQRKRARMANDDELGKTLFKWIKEQRALGAPLSSSIIKEKAEILKKKLMPNEDTEFGASDSWFGRRQKRDGIGVSVTYGEKRSADLGAASKLKIKPADLKKKLDELIIQDQQIYNSD